MAYVTHLTFNGLVPFTEQKELAEKMRAQEKAELSRFRKYVEDRVDRFSKDDRKYIEFETMDKIYRGIM